MDEIDIFLKPFDFGHETCNAHLLLQRLRDDTENEIAQELAQEIKANLAKYRCSRCGQTARVATGLQRHKLVFACVDCSGKAVQEMWERDQRLVRK